MKQYTVYVCETCGCESKNRDEMREHEAAHLGLTVEEMEAYNALKSFARYMGSVVSTTNNETTRRRFDRAIDNLIVFERRHRIKI